MSTEALEFELHSPQPNPFGTASAIRLDLPKSTKVALRVLDPTGRRVRTLMQGDASAGSYTRVWDGRDDQGREVGAGVYFIAVSASGLGERSVKLIHLR